MPHVRDSPTVTGIDNPVHVNADSERERLENVVQSLLIATFDIYFQIDERLCIISDSAKLHHFFAIPGGQPASGRPLEVFIPNEQDKARFKLVINQARELFVPLHLVRTPPVARMSMVIEGVPRDVDMTILPGLSTGHTRQNLDEFLVCINLVSQTEMVKSNPSSILKLRHFPEDHSRRVTQVHSDHPNRKSLGPLGRLNELSPGVNSENDGVCGTTRAPRHLLLIKSLSRDLQESVSRSCNDLGHSKSVWLEPRMLIHDQVVLQDELVRTLSSESQRSFVDALVMGDCKGASSILSRSAEGNLDIFNHQTLGATIKSSQLISATFRLFLGIAIATENPTAAVETLHGLSQWAYRIHTKYTITKGVLINTHLSLAIATVALKFPSRFNCDATRLWVTRTFASCFSCHQAFRSESDETSPLLYWVTLMWAGVLKQVSKSSDAGMVLESLRVDIAEYLMRHPMCHSVSQLNNLCLNNISVIRNSYSLRTHNALNGGVVGIVKHKS